MSEQTYYKRKNGAVIRGSEMLDRNYRKYDLVPCDAPGGSAKKATAKKATAKKVASPTAPESNLTEETEE